LVGGVATLNPIAQIASPTLSALYLLTPPVSFSSHSVNFAYRTYLQDQRFYDSLST
jgi:hypothetical protein